MASPSTGATAGTFSPQNGESSGSLRRLASTTATYRLRHLCDIAEHGAGGLAVGRNELRPRTRASL